MIKKRLEDFKTWQQSPSSVAPMSDEDHVCSTCQTEFRGNFCPRCGQSAKIEQRMSLGKTIFLFLDVWGLGNRNMFRTARDLILRPGYLICDYLQGKRNAYFPPFKLLFLLTTLSLLVGHGFNLAGENYQVEIPPFSTESSILAVEKMMEWINALVKFQNGYPALFQLGFIVVFGFFYYLFFRKSKILGKLNYHEFFIGLVYMVDMYLIFNTFFRFFGYFGIDRLYFSILMALYIIPLKQMSGYGWFNTVSRVIGATIVSGVAGLVIFISMVSLAVVLYPE